jgi:hypothetical protein
VENDKLTTLLLVTIWCTCQFHPSGTTKINKDKGFKVLQFNLFATEQSLPVLIAEC